jgi:hypothetical protein
MSAPHVGSRKAAKDRVGAEGPRKSVTEGRQEETEAEACLARKADLPVVQCIRRVSAEAPSPGTSPVGLTRPLNQPAEGKRLETL